MFPLYVFTLLSPTDLHTIATTSNLLYGDVRLVGNQENGRGAVEISTNLGWTTICPDSSWTDSDANAICQILGYDFGRSDK